MKKADLPQLFLRLALGIGFLFPVCDRLGLLGAPGEKFVSWGQWSKFVEYTNTLLPFLNNATANFAAITATVAEIIFGIALLVGFKTKYMALGSALLTGLFGICMALFTGVLSPVVYPVFVFTGAAWLLACVADYKYSVDNLLKK